ncbi:hypothetical protein KKF81_04635 [Candidatus Micrarchaeota archaeon]|nr:hypothetical protein [Candidatus Micrarchaeota archaeon]MBU1166213.1 hypothetical protein [Candidatus Micrarchaeota archaeon]MBU1886248.1 hypothetical protein [Candidatus Micrarchaeota archaeon]
MPVATLALRYIPTFQSTPATAFLGRAKDVIETISKSFFISGDIRARVQDAIDRTIELVDQQMGKDQQRKSLHLDIAETNREAAKMSAEGYEFPICSFDSEKLFTKKEFINEKTNKPEKGEYDNNFCRIIINLETMRGAHLKHESQEACLLATAIHETLHHLGGFNRFQDISRYRFNMMWLIDGLTEILTRDFLVRLYTEEAKYFECASYESLLDAVKKLSELVGEEVLTTSYFSRSLFPVLQKLKLEGLTDKEVEDLLRLGHQINCTTNIAQRDNICKQLTNYIDRLIKRKQGRQYVNKFKDKPGMSPEAIEGVRYLLPETQKDQASRLVLDAYLFYKLRQPPQEPTTYQIFETLASVYERSDGIVAKIVHSLMGEATRTISDIPIPTVWSSPQVLDQQSQGTSIFASVGMSQEQFLPFDSVQTTLSFGQNISYDNSVLVEAAAIDYMIKHSGELPGVQELQNTISISVEQTAKQEAISPDAGILTTNILSSTADFIQDRTIAENDSWITDPANNYLENNSSVVPLFCQSYSDENKSEIGEVLNQTEEFQGYGSIVAERCNTFFSEIGVEPTCGEIFGLAAHAASAAQETGLSEKESIEIKSGISGFNPNAHAALQILDGWRLETWNEMKTEYDDHKSEPTTIQTAWHARGKDNLKLSAATETFATILRIENPEDVVEYNNDCIVALVSPHGRQKKVGDTSYGETVSIAGSTGGLSDPRRKIPDMPMHQDILRTEGKAVQWKGLGYEEFELPQNAREIAHNIGSNVNGVYERAYALFDVVKSNGKLGIKGNMYLEDRKEGSKTVNEVITERIGNCLELSMVYLAMADIVFGHENITIFPIDVVNPEARVEIGHVCIGILMEDNRIHGHPAFEHDWKSREKILKRCGMSDKSELKLLVIDPVNDVFDYRFHNVEPLNVKELLSLFNSNSFLYALMRGAKSESEACFDRAEELWPVNPRVLEYKADQIADVNASDAISFLLRVKEGYRTSGYYYRLGKLYSEIGDNRNALKFFNKAIAVNRNHVGALERKAFMHINAGTKLDVEQAKIVLSQWIDILTKERKESGSHQRRSIERQKKLDFTFDTRDLFGSQNSLLMSFHVLSIVQLMSGEVTKAYLTCKKGLEFVPTSCYLRETKAIILAIAAARLKQVQPEESRRLADEAIIICNELLRDNPSRGLTHLIIGYAAHVKGDRQQQVEQFRTFGRIMLENQNLLPPERLTAVIHSDFISASDFIHIYAECMIFGRHVLKCSDWERTFAGEQFDAFVKRARPIKIISLVSRETFGGNVSSGRGRMRLTAMRRFVEKTQQKTSLVLQVQRSRLSEAEKALLITLLSTSPERRKMEIEMLIALNHESMMRRMRIKPNETMQTRIDSLTEYGGKTTFITKDYIQLAKLRLGKIFDEKYDEIENALEIAPLGIDKEILRNGADFAKRYVIDSDGLMKRAVEYLSLMDLPPTDENIKRVLPEIRHYCGIGRSVLGEVIFIDPFCSKFTT